MAGAGCSMFTEGDAKFFVDALACPCRKCWAFG
jgi:hypothetical protein